MKRRRAVSLTASSLAFALAGCLGDDSDDSGDPSDDGTDNRTDGQGPQDDDQPDESDGADAPFGGGVEGISQGGYLALGASSESDARSNGFSLPAQSRGEDPIVVTATTAADGTWESTEVAFKSIPIDDPIEGEIQVGLPGGLSGELDPEQGRMTATGELVATVTAGGDELGEIRFRIDATTGESGALTGAAAFDGEPASVTLVDNEFAVEESGNPIIDGFAGLPSEVGENWFELELDLSSASG